MELNERSQRSDRAIIRESGPTRPGADYVLYWMQQAQRPRDNAALDYAISVANELGLPVLVVFGLTPDYPEANIRHFAFMLEGLSQTAMLLGERGVGFRMRCDAPARTAAVYASQAAAVVTDGAYLRHTREWRDRIARDAGCPVVEVDTELVVPVRIASEKREFAARTIRPKLHRRVDDYLTEPENLEVRVIWRPELTVAGDQTYARSEVVQFTEADLSDVPGLLDRLPVDTSVPPVTRLYTGGPEAADARFGRFLEERFSYYSDHRNQPHTDDTSGMSMHLQFGQISPIRLLLEARRFVEGYGDEVRQQYEDFYEELLVRRELAYNYCFYEPRYDSYDALPDWALRTLSAHSHDERSPLYSLEELEQSETGDEYWNAAMTEMRLTGYMHNYMRMYWGKQILLWSPTPEEAFRRLLYLNNRHFIDGRNPASFANCGWIFGLHDRPWTERSVFGKVRIMVPAGLKRKCDMPAYIEKVEKLSRIVQPN